MKPYSPSARPRRYMRHHARRALHAFTLVELLAIIGVLAFLVSIMASGLTKTNLQSKSVRCINNQRQLMTAWRMYAADNREEVIYNFGIPQIWNEIANHTYRNWANNIMSWDRDSMNTNVALLQAGIFPPYFGANANLYRCPADNYPNPIQIALGWTARTRSISMNAFFGPGLSWPTTSPLPYAGQNEGFSSYRQWLRTYEVQHPAKAWVLIEEHPDSINDGYFINNPAGSGQWGDVPAAFHDRGCTLGFADEHVELHKWLSKNWQLPVKFFYGSVPFDLQGRIDDQWLTARTAEPYR